MKVELKKPHTHDGKDYQVGDIIEVSETLAEWLIRNKIAKFSEADQPEAVSLKKKKGGYKRWA